MLFLPLKALISISAPFSASYVTEQIKIVFWIKTKYILCSRCFSTTNWL